MRYVEGEKLKRRPVDPSHFTGEASVARVMVGAGGDGVRIYRVSFQPGSRTNWHLHTGVQVLCIEEGKGIVQKAGTPPVAVKAGDIVYIKAGEKHWHGAGPQKSMTHLAINLGEKTEWLAPVSDSEYAAV